MPRPSDTRYLYRGTFLRAVDGDTVILRINLGFYVQAEQRLRLALIVENINACVRDGSTNGYPFRIGNARAG